MARSCQDTRHAEVKTAKPDESLKPAGAKIRRFTLPKPAA
ncbi:hypothetical protein PMI06_009458 [Burkholderia sp. BT03]|nr:hypothetical protein PMI06_009458 [Burkholderia sp. BT03]SKC94850.1 hypothetical protein SAMN06266956_6620 [Paraburkholderia hospita]